MYTLNFTRLIGLIFIVSRLILIVKATDPLKELPTCTGISTGCAAAQGRKAKRDLKSGNYCTYTESEVLNLYYVGSESACTKQDTANTYVFVCTEGACSEVGSTSITAKSNLLVYTVPSSGAVTQTKNKYYYDGTNSRLIKCESGGACTLITADGYYLLTSDNSNESSSKLINISTTNGNTTTADKTSNIGSNTSKSFLDASSKRDDNYEKVITCSNDGSTTTCKSENGAVGNYNNGDISSALENALIECTEAKKCKTSKAKAGVYEHASDKTIIIKCSAESGCVSESGVANKIYPDISTQDTDDTSKYTKIIKCETQKSKVSCTSKFVAGTFLNAGTTTGLTDAIINCASDECHVVAGIDGGYIVNTANTGTVISCTSGGCTDATKAAANHYYLDAINTGKLISCTATACTSGTGTAGHYLNAGDGKSVITCTSSECVLEDATIKGYFINSGNNKASNPIIKCDGTTNTPCTLVAKASISSYPSSSPVGSVKYGSKATLCLATGCTGANEIEIKINTAASAKDTYKTLEASNGFPGASSEEAIAIKIGKDGTAILLEDGGLPTCGESCTPDIHCIDGSGVIKTAASGDTTCTAITGTATGTAPVYFKSDNTKLAIGDITVTNVPTLAYICKFGETTYPATSCTLVKGNIIDSSKYIQCSGWKRDGCVVSTTAPSACSASSGEGPLGKDSDNNVICFNENVIALPAAGATNPSIVLFETAEVNPIYGVKAAQVTALALTATSVTVTTDATLTADTYYLNLSVTGTLENAIIKCTGTALSTCSKVDGSPGYYLNAGGDQAAKPLIKCDTTAGCVTEVGIKDGYYIDASEPSNIINCSATDTCTSAEHGATVQNHYLDNTNSGRVITCTPTGCFLEDKALKGYFLNSVANATIKVIQCNGEKCELPSGTIPNECSTAGNVIVSSDTVSLCITTSDSKEIKVDASAEPTYTTVTIAKANDFPGAAEGDIAVKIGTDGSAILLEKPTEGLPACGASTAGCKDSTGGEVPYCFDSSAKTIKKTNVNGATKSCSALVLTDIGEGLTEAGSYAILFDSEGQKVEEDAANPNVFAYFCTFANANTLTACALVNGGYVLGKDGSVTQCSGWRREGCIIEEPSGTCSDTTILTLDSSKKICFGAEAVELSSSTIAVSPAEVNTIYGILPEEIKSLKISENSVLVDDSAGKKKKKKKKVDYIKLFLYCFFLLFIYCVFFLNK